MKRLTEKHMAGTHSRPRGGGNALISLFANSQNTSKKMRIKKRSLSKERDDNNKGSWDYRILKRVDK